MILKSGIDQLEEALVTLQDEVDILEGQATTEVCKEIKPVYTRQTVRGRARSMGRMIQFSSINP